MVRIECASEQQGLVEPSLSKPLNMKRDRDDQVWLTKFFKAWMIRQDSPETFKGGSLMMVFKRGNDPGDRGLVFEQGAS